MVFKISKGGVRTGNTLRGLHSTRTKRYGRHACLLGCTSLGRRDLGRLIGDSSNEDEDTELVRETLSKTNVLLSLNKQQRWRLPSLIGHMIKRDDFNKGAMVSLLERHKLKRRANCVRLVSNNKKTQNIVPKQKKYFSCSLDSFCGDESNRQRRRARAEELKGLTKEKALKKAIDHNYSTVKTYTSDGDPSSVHVSSLSSDKPEYRLEVFYPCPQSCSLTYNPKYTDVVIAEGKDGEMEVKSNVKTKKKGATKHRKRLLKKDIDNLRFEAIDEDESDVLEEFEDDLPVDDSEYSVNLKPSNSYSIDTNIIQILLEQAKKTRELCINKKETLHRSGKKSKSPHFESTEQKPHIRLVKRESSKKKTIPTHDNTNDDNLPNLSLDFVRVILPTSEVSPEELRRKYGNRYTEALCQPRRFVIDVTEDISNVLSTSKASTQELDFSSYLVCVNDGYYDNGLVACKIALNSMAVRNMQGLRYTVPFAETSIPDIMNAIACHVLDIKDSNAVNIVEKNSTHKITNNNVFLNSRIQVKVEVLDRHDMTKVIFPKEGDGKSGSDLRNELQCVEIDDEDMFCDVCYASVTSSKLDSVDGTTLNACGHLLCNECWASHFRINIKNGKTVMSCGGYDCKTEIELFTLMSVLHVSEINILLERQADAKLEAMDNAKYCPNKECGRVIMVESKSRDLCVDVMCACGVNICFTCLGPAHWPARCEQAEEYIERLPDIKEVNSKYNGEELTEREPLPPLVPNKSKQPQTMKVEGGLCPRCKRFIEKNGGCRFMYCKCGQQICWDCMKPYHYEKCSKDQGWLYNHRRLLLVKHLQPKKIVPLDSVDVYENDSVPAQKSRQKSSLYQRAFEQRKESMVSGKCKSNRAMLPLLNKMTKAAHRDVQFKTEVVNALVPHLHSNDEPISVNDFNVNPYLKTFLQTAVEMKTELHHVTEYTFILLQGTPQSVAKQRILKLANDLSGYCSFVTSILSVQENQDAQAAFRRLVNLQDWAKRALDALIRTSHSLRSHV